MTRSIKKRLLSCTDAVGLTRQIVLPRLRRFVLSHAMDGLTLDLGCGAGPFAKAFPSRIGVDRRPCEAVDVIADAHDLSHFPDGTFCCVLLTEVLEHLHTPQLALDEIYRVLRQGGTLILTTRFIFPLHDVPADYFRYTRYGLEHLLRRFEIVELKPETNSMTAIAVLLQRLAFQTRTLYFLPINTVWLLLARLFQLFSFVITREWGQKWGGPEERSILTSGYYVICRKTAALKDPVSIHRDLAAD